MRIVKELTIEDIHVVIFKMEQKFTLKLEWNRIEQVFKLDVRDGVSSVEDVLVLIDESFIQRARSIFIEMNENKYVRLAAVQDLGGEEFPEII